MLSLLFALACVPSSGNLDVTSTGNPNGNVDDTGDTGEEQVEPHFAAGDYQGELGWWIPDAWDGWVICEMELELTVDDQGNFSAGDTCIYYGQYDNYDLDVQLDGVFDEDGEVTGTVTFETWFEDGDWWLEELEAELRGDTDGEDIQLEFEQMVWLYGYELDLEGWVDLAQ